MRRLLATLVLVLLTIACHRVEPVAGGKPLSHWKKEAKQVSLFTFWNSTKDERRREAFRRLSEIGEPAVPALVDLMRHGNISVSGDAFNALANLGPRAASAVPQMLEMVRSGTPARQRHATWILGTIGPAAEPAVADLEPLLRHPDRRLRETAATALGQIGGSGHAALERARTSGDVRQREASMRGMDRRSLDPASRRELVAAGLADPSPEVRERTLDLFRTVTREEAEMLAEYLVRALNDSAPQVNRPAHGVLTYYMQGQLATPRLLAVVLEGGDAPARADAAWRLGHMMSDLRVPGVVPDEPAVIDALVAALKDPEPKIRIYAGRALAYASGQPREQGIRQLRREVSSGEPILRVRAARVLWDVEQSVAEVRPAYESGLKDQDKWNRVETISAIMAMGKDAATFVPHVERLLNDPAGEVRDRAQKFIYAIRARGAPVKRI